MPCIDIGPSKKQGSAFSTPNGTSAAAPTPPASLAAAATATNGTSTPVAQKLTSDGLSSGTDDDDNPSVSNPGRKRRFVKPAFGSGAIIA